MSDNRLTRGILGIANLGNTCFINSTLQALRHCPEWTLFCSQGKVNQHIADPDKQSSIILLAYQDLIKTIWGSSGPGYVKPFDFYNKLRIAVKGTIYEEFTHRNQQDAHEFLVWLLDQMYMATQKEVEIEIYNKSSLPNMVVSAITGWKAAFEKQYSPLTDLVFGMYRIQYKCTGCSTVHNRWETFNTLKVSIGPEQILDLLINEFKEEDIDGYACDACKNKCLAKKNVSIWRLPKLMIITLKRFTPMGTRDNGPFNYDGKNIMLDKIFSPESSEESKTREYKIFSTIDHHGNHNGGHYTSQALCPVWKKWHLYDDESVNEINEPQFGVYTYMLFFRPA